MLAVAAILFTAIPATAISSAAATKTPLQTAIEYADAHSVDCGTPKVNGRKYNTAEYKTNPGADCANFVSQILDKSGVIQQDDIRDYKKANKWCYNKTDTTKPWSGAWYTSPELKDYLIDIKKIPNTKNPKDSDIEVGDVVFTNGPTKEYGHVGFCVAKDGSTPLIDAHTNDRHHNRWGQTNKDAPITWVVHTSALFKAAEVKTPDVLVSVSFDAGKGTGSQCRIYAANKPFGTLPETTRSGYIFAGWYTAKTGGTKITPETVVENKKNIKYYARWDATVTFDANEGDGSCCRTVTENTAVKTLPTATRLGYTLTGWYTKRDKGGTKLTSSTKITKNITYYARWKKNPAPLVAVTQYRSRELTYSWGNWSSWSTANPGTSNSNKEVQTQQNITGYNIFYYCTQEAASPYTRVYRNFSINGKYNEYGARQSYGEFNKQKTVSKSVWESASSVNAGSSNSKITYGGKNSGSAAAKIIDGYMWYLSSANYGTEYRFRTRTENWGKWSAWQDTPITETNTRGVETRIIYR